MSEANRLDSLVGGFVFIAYYWTGFTDDGVEVLAICDSRKMANAALREHKRTRDTTGEYANRVNWWVRRERIRTANSSLDRHQAKQKEGRIHDA